MISFFKNYDKQFIVIDITLLLFGVTSAFCLWQFYLAGDNGVEIFYLPQTIYLLIESKEFWRLFSPSLIHFDEGHLLSNLILFCYFGRMIGRVSYVWLLSLILSSSLISNCAEWAHSGPLFGGASGIVAAMAGFLIINQLLKPSLNFSAPFWLLVVFFVYLLVVSTGHFGLYSNAAHFSGAIWGVLMGCCFIKWPPEQKESIQ